MHDGIALDKIIIPACKNDIYKVVNCEYTNKPLVEMMDGNVTLTNTNIAENENVVMLYNGKYYGPYKAKRRIGDGKYYIKPDITNYLVPFIRTSKFSVLSLKSSRIMMIRQRHSLYMRQVPGNRLTLFRTRSC